MEDHFPKLDGVLLADRYLLTEEVGRGGFGVVYRGTQLNINRDIAVKILPPQFMAIPDVVARFKREAQLASLLRHPNTITIHDYGSQDNMLYIVMELLRGEDLADILKRERRLSKERIVRITKQILKSLAEAHEHGIVHRDLKPENIFLHQVAEEPDFVKVLDFGIAKLAQPGGQSSEGRQLTVSGSTVGTPVYMSPEQAAGEEVDAQTDLYALGVIMYEMLTGRPPFQDQNPVKVMRAHLFTPVPPLPDEVRGTLLEHVILRALEKEKDARYRSAREFLKELEKTPSKVMPLPQDLSAQLRSLQNVAPPTSTLEEDSEEPPTLELRPEDEASLDEDSAPAPRLNHDTAAFDQRQAPKRSALSALEPPPPSSSRSGADYVPFEQLSASARQPIIEGASASGLTTRSGILPAPASANRPQYLPELSSAGLNTVSSILTIVEPSPQEEEVILLTRPKHTPQQGLAALPPQTNPKWEVSQLNQPPAAQHPRAQDLSHPEIRLPQASDAHSSPYSTDEKPVPLLVQQARQATPSAPASAAPAPPQPQDTSDDEELEEGQPPAWTWGNPDLSAELAQRVESGAYPQHQQRTQEAKARQRQLMTRGLGVALILLVLALLGIIAATQLI